MILPWYRVSTMGPIPSISRGGWRSKPPEWVMRHEFAAVVAAGMVKDWSLTQLAARWICGRKQAKRVIREWTEEAVRLGWDEALLGVDAPWSIASVHAHHQWLRPANAPVAPMRVESQVPGRTDELQVVTGTDAPATPRECPGDAPASRARVPFGDVEGDGDSSSDFGTPNPDLESIWFRLYAIRKSHMKLRGSGKGYDPERGRLLKRRLDEVKKATRRSGPLTGMDPVEVLVIAAGWMHTSDSPQAEGARKTGDAIGTLLRKKCVQYCEQAVEDQTGGAAKGPNGFAVGDRAWQLLQAGAGRDTKPGDGWHFSDRDPTLDPVAIEAVEAVWGSWRAMGSDTGIDFKSKQFKQAFKQAFSRSRS